MPDFTRPNYEYITDQSRVAGAAEELAREDILAVDIEASALDPYFAQLLLFQIGTPEKAYVFAGHLDLTPLKPLLESPQKLKLLQNAKFDYGMLKHLCQIEVRNMYDTMLAERLLTNGRERRMSSLGVLAQKYLDLTLDKDYDSYRWDVVAATGRVTEKHLIYAALDVLVLFPIFEKQYVELTKEDLLPIARLEFRVAPVVAEMELRGSFIDVDRWREHIQELSLNRDEAARRLQEEVRPLYNASQLGLFGEQADAINLNSQPQLLELLNDKLNLSAPSTGSAVLKSIRHPVAEMLLEYRGYEKLISAFGEGLLEKVHPKTGRLHPDFMQLRAETGRFACARPNLQQIPKDSAFRECFVAPPGYKLITADYSQAELRILAEVSGDPVLIDAYKSGQDLHAYTASQMFRVPIEKVRKDVERFQAKSINFGLMYGRGANSLAAQIKVSPEEGKRLLKLYFQTYRKVKVWLDKAASDAVKKGYAVTLGGRKRWFTLPEEGDPSYERQVSSIERQGKNTPIQGTSADMTKYALVYIFDRIRQEGWEAYLIHTVHDEIVIEVREEIGEEVRQAVREEMVRAGELLLKKVPIVADAVLGDVWGH